MTAIAIMIGTPQGSRLLAFSSEREAACTVEMLLRQLDWLALPAPFWVQCADHVVTRRLTNYLLEIQAELIKD